jgi:chemotaxis receptor (MCP) glutamine deamidase CheD
MKTQMQQCLITIQLGNCKARALLDSGSAISAMNGNLFQKSEFASLPLKTPKRTTYHLRRL